MASAPSVPIPRRWTPHLWWAFLLIIAGFLLAGISSIYVMRKTLTGIEAIEDRALASIELAFRLSHYFDVRRRLFEAHIVATRSTDMKEIEQRLSDVSARIAATCRDYEPTIADDVEREDWQKLQEEIADLEPQTERVIDLSRRNRDLEARTAMRAIDPQFDEINRTMRGRVRLNSTRVAGKVYMIRNLQRTAGIFLIVLMVGFTIFVLSVAKWVTRLISQREVRMIVAARQLEEQNRELDAFAGRVAHDLRGPLTAINLAAFDQGVPHQERTSAVFRRAVKQMEAIVQDLLMLSRVSTKTTETRCQAAGVIASAEEDLRPKLEAAGRHTSHRSRCRNGNVQRRSLTSDHVEPRRKRRKVPARWSAIERRNTRTNPAAYQRTERIRQRHGYVALGSPTRIRAFFRGQQVLSTPGTGLRLSIVKRAVEASGGSVSIDSTVGRGRTFTIDLPLAERKAA